ncbi:MAG: cysteine desulfurase [Pirellulales bacterium]|nr:cysteine desulfurase [Pirellulales bacterium]
MTPIYLDHNAATPTRPEVAEAMSRCCAAGYANTASGHRCGQQARRIVEDARRRAAALLGADLTGPQPDRLIWTSGGTEANNLAVLGIAPARETSKGRSIEGDRPIFHDHCFATVPEKSGQSPGRIVISAIEHPSVIEPAEHLMERGWRLDTLGANPDGVLRMADLPPLLSAETRLVSVILGNHETGVMQPVAEAVQSCRPLGVPVHTDAVQVVGKRPVDFRRLGVSALSLSAHKFGGPPGIGVLILRHDAPITPLFFGGQQQDGLRPGTEPIPLIVGMLTALELASQEQAETARRLKSLRRRFEESLQRTCPEILIHGRSADRLPQTSNLAFPGVDGQMLLIALDAAGVACSIGSACASGSTGPSPTLRAMNLPDPIVRSSLRFSLGADQTASEIDQAVEIISRVYHQLRRQEYPLPGRG